MMIKILIIIIYIEIYYLIDEPGRLNINYQIMNYNGSFVKDTFMIQSFLIDEPTKVKWSDGKFLSERGYLFIADKKENLIKMLTKECKYSYSI